MEVRIIEFDATKTVANHVKTDILAKASFGDIDVAVWELEVSFSGAAKLTSPRPRARASRGPPSPHSAACSPSPRLACS
ncbi:hypothetical protein BC826DRAFT_1037646 [Russula brevipes]|nr:hypothetical protein BC826DRAFT_1037646 [Russula brevipes]